MADRGIGRGLSAILPDAADRDDPELRELPVELVRPNPNQPRRRFEPDALDRLARSIDQAGLVQPIVVTPLAGGTYEIVAGERRWRAATMAGLERIPALVRDHDEGDRLEAALVENMVREDLNPVEEARACATLVEDLGLTREQLADRVGRSRSAVSNLIRLLELPEEALEQLSAGVLTEGHGRAILVASGQARRIALSRQAAEEGWSVRETERRARGEEPRARRRRSRPRRELADPDAEQLRLTVEDRLGSVAGTEVRVRVSDSGAVAELRCGDLTELATAVARLTSPRGGPAVRSTDA
ncbi:MAG: ParB/RepB/Spo0J family partition protein [Solirubrobacterales bacterium]